MFVYLKLHPYYSLFSPLSLPKGNHSLPMTILDPSLLPIPNTPLSLTSYIIHIPSFPHIFNLSLTTSRSLHWLLNIFRSLTSQKQNKEQKPSLEPTFSHSYSITAFTRIHLITKFLKKYLFWLPPFPHPTHVFNEGPSWSCCVIYTSTSYP